MTRPTSSSRSDSSSSNSSNDRHASSSPRESSPPRSPVLKAFLFGHPISHSLAPLMHHTLWDSTQQDLADNTKSAFQFTLLDSLSQRDCLAALTNPHYVGCSITMPHKLTLMDQVDGLSEEARIIGAINTIYIRRDWTSGEREIIGTNTDCIGIRDAFLRSFLRQDHCTVPETNTSLVDKMRGKTALVIGAGGTARAAIYALWKFFDIRFVYLINRFEHEAEEVVISMRRAGCTVEMKYVSTLEEIRYPAFESPVMVVGTVPDVPARTMKEVTMKELVDEILSRRRASDTWLLDMCYHPNPTTSLMKRASAQGWQTISGIEALKYQGIKQFELWSGTKVGLDAMLELSKVMDNTVLGTS